MWNMNLSFLDKYQPKTIESVNQQWNKINNKEINQINKLTQYYNSFRGLKTLTKTQLWETKKYIIFTLNNNTKQ